MGFDDPEYEREFRQQRAAAEYRQAQLDDHLNRAAEAEGARDFLVAADRLDRAAGRAGIHQARIFRKRASQMRRLAKNGGDYAALSSR
jgi:hypothetical protein